MAEAFTPLMQQYRRIKREIPADVLLLFRLGDFYELFFEDAKVASSLLHLTLTHRNGSPMCGIPHHAAEGYLARLIRAGRKVALCEQIEESGAAKGLMKREVTQILSPGTVMADRFLAAHQNNYIAAVCPGGPGFGLAFLDITTGDFRVSELDGADALAEELRRLAPAEVIVPEGALGLSAKLDDAQRFSSVESWIFERETAWFALRDHFKTQSLDGFGCQDLTVAIGAAGGLLHYLKQQLRRDLSHVHGLRVEQPQGYMALDAAARRNLELFEPQAGAVRHSTLIGAMDRTETPMGARLLREWITRPLRRVEEIGARLQAVDELQRDGSPSDALRERLREVKDLERVTARLASGSGNARDLLGLRLSLERLPALRAAASELHAPLLMAARARIAEFAELAARIARAIADDPPLALKEGGLIRDGFDPTLDELRAAARSGKEWIAQLQQREVERTGVKSLKIRFNSVFGYYIEITKSNLAQVPPDYVRKQTVASGERFVTPELKEMEGKILGAEERSMKLEYEIFQQIRAEVGGHSAAIQETARAVAAVDALAGFAELARQQGYARPVVDDGDAIEIVEGRHPVLEQVMQTDPNHLGRGGFVPNDARLDADQNQVILITGPNMAGKSTYIRQVALLTLMAQAGSFVPAQSARIGVVDRIFTRVGASDDLARGQSTFMVEMNETANILNNATDRSLVILDEIGRGTSTYDGISIAWAVAEYLHDHLRAKTLFATHYHELTAMARRFPRVKNFNVAVREWNDQVIFLRKIQSGGADRSYGIQVARLAGLPPGVIARAKEMLDHFEASDQQVADVPRREGEAVKPWPEGRRARPRRRKRPIMPTAQMLLFAAGGPSENVDRPASK
ncbi:MAG: DNA mismatch repair protein MutS [Verrucomicrobiae bacterium]|nr:DNA mismatch repair protein MutS [Verrucomicrobiae bacterium]